MTNVGFLVDKFGEPLKTPVMTDEMRKAGAASFAGVTPNGLVGSDGASIPGVPTAAQLSRAPVFSFADPNTPAMPSGLQQGTKIVDISTATTANLTSATVPTSGFAMSSGGKALHITGNGANTPKGDITVFGGGLPATFPLSSANKSINFYAFKPVGGVPSPMLIYLSTTSGFSVFSYCQLLIYPGLHLYTLTLPQGAAASPWAHAGGGVFGLNCGAIRVGHSPYASGYPLMQSTDYVEIGDWYLDMPISKARIIFDFDANGPDLIHPGANAIAGGDGVIRNQSFCSMLASYGWSPTVGIITGQVGNIAGTLAVRDWQYARDKYGAAIISHTHKHVGLADVAGAAAGSGGYPLQGPYGFSIAGAVQYTAASTGLTFTPTNDLTEIQADTDQWMTLLNKWGFTFALRHLSLSQGGYDISTSQALEAYGFASIRAALGNFAACPNQFGLATVPVATSGQFNDCQSSMFNRQMVLQLDGSAIPQAAMTAFVDKVWSGGGIGSFYTHSCGTSATTLANIKMACDTVKVYETAGKCDVVTAYAIGAR